jgi:hypothetical protein
MARGGRIEPDGRPPVAPGVGKTARRHDLEQPATPGLAGSDLQQGDVQRLEQAQQIAPIKPQAPARPQATTSKPRRNTSSTVDTPDPIDFIAGRVGGQPFTQAGGSRAVVDPTPWLPLINAVATTPGAGGAVGAALVRILAMKGRQALNPQTTVIDRQELDAQLGL